MFFAHRTPLVRRLPQLVFICCALVLLGGPLRAQSDSTGDPKPPLIVDTLIAGAEFPDPDNGAIRLAFQWGAIAYENNVYDLLHRTQSTPVDAFYQLHASQGRPTHLAADAQSLYLLFESRSVLAITYNLQRDDAPAELLPILSDRVLPMLPSKGRVLGWTAVASGPVALIAKDTFTSEPNTPPLQLYQLVNGRWQMLPLPEGLKPNRFRALAPTTPRRNRFAILADTPNGSASNCVLHVYNDGQWSRQAYTLPPAVHTQAASVQNNFYVLQQHADTPQQLHAYRLRGGQAQPVGVFKQPQPIHRFQIAPNAHALSAFVIDPDQKLAWASIDFSPKDTPTTFVAIAPQPMPMPDIDPATVLVLIAVIVGMAFLFMTTRSDPAENTPNLPRHITLGNQNRALAALIDLAPCVGLTVWWFDLPEPTIILRHWPIFDPELSQVLPSVTVIGLLAAHTTLTELFTASTLGKAVCGCRVVDLNGKPPHVWQVLTRNAFKALEMAVPYLLILPLLSPFRQRLGDLIAKTVVVNKPSSPPPHPDSDSEDASEQDPET